MASFLRLWKRNGSKKDFVSTLFQLHIAAGSNPNLNPNLNSSSSLARQHSSSTLGLAQQQSGFNNPTRRFSAARAKGIYSSIQYLRYEPCSVGAITMNCDGSFNDKYEHQLTVAVVIRDHFADWVEGYSAQLPNELKCVQNNQLTETCALALSVLLCYKFAEKHKKIEIISDCALVVKIINALEEDYGPFKVITNYTRKLLNILRENGVNVTVDFKNRELNTVADGLADLGHIAGIWKTHKNPPSELC